MKILHLIDSFNENAQQLRRIALAHGDSVEVCCLGRETTACADLRRHGIPTHALGWTRWFDVGALWHLRDVVREATPDVIHVWSLAALRALALVAPSVLSRVVMNAPLPARGLLAWWDRRLLDRVCCLAFADVHDQEQWVRQNVMQPEQRVIPPVAGAAWEGEAPAGPRTRNDLIANNGTETSGSAGASPSRIVCLGSERDDDCRRAIWAFDILLFLYADLQLQLIGADPALQVLSRGLRNEASVHFLDANRATEAIQAADIVWIPSLTNHGHQTALDAMALGKPVIASDVPCLQALIRDGETGLLVPPGDVIALARRTHALIQDAALGARIGQAVRDHVLRRYPIGDAVERWRKMYAKAAA